MVRSGGFDEYIAEKNSESIERAAGALRYAPTIVPADLVVPRPDGGAVPERPRGSRGQPPPTKKARKTAIIIARPNA